ncbi:MAG TPA: hypothetical protein PKH20_01415, partial [Exilispira sp.]|nr:hypothetical protein [Exilispira sp.]
GFVLIDNSEALFDRTKEFVTQIVNNWILDNSRNWNELKKRIQNQLKSYFMKEIAREPLILSLIIEV